MIIGMTWLRTHNPVINWRSGKIEFTRCPRYCQLNLPILGGSLSAASTMTEYPDSLAPHTINVTKHHSQEWAIKDFKTRKVLTMDDIKSGPFSDFADVFEDVITHTLPPHRSFDHRIEFIEGWEQKKWPIRTYRPAPDEEDELNKFIDNMKKNRFIRDSSSSLASPVFFIRKKDGKKCLVVDYQNLNAITKPMAYTIPHINNLIQKWKGCTYFCTLDI